MGHHHHKHNHGHHCHDEGSSPSADYPPVLAYPAIGTPVLAYPAIGVPPYPSSEPWGYAPPVEYGLPVPAIQQEEQLNHARADVHRHSRNERIWKIAAAVAGAFVLYKPLKTKMDPAHARKHKLAAKVAGAVALGSAGYAYHEHLEKKKSEHIVENLNGESYFSNDHHHKHRRHGRKEKKHHRHLLKL